MPEKCNVPAEEREALFELFPNCTSPEEDDELRQIFTQYLFYHRLDCKRRSYLCTACCDLWVDQADRYGHNDAYYCPHCKQRVTLKAVGRMGRGMTNVGYSSLFEAHNVVFFHRSDDGGLLASGGRVEVIYRPGETDGVGWPGVMDELDGLVWPVPELNFCERRRYYMAPGRLASWKRSYGHINRGIFGSCFRSTGWESVGTAGEPNPADSVMNSQPDNGLYYAFGLDSIGSSNLKFSAVEQYFVMEPQLLYRGLVTYLARYTRRPQIEMLVKLGHTNVIDAMLDGDLMGGIVNWRAKAPHTFFRLSKADYKVWAASGGSIDVLRKWRGYDGKLTLSQFAGAVALVGTTYAGEVLTVSERYGVSIGKLTTYLKKHPCMIQTWLDYVRMGERVGVDFTRQDVLLPKDLRLRHDRLAEQIEYMDNTEKLKKYRRRLRALQSRYELEASGYLIRVPKTGAEIHTEGNALCHCVGGYADKHMQGKTTILFLRDAEIPDKPLCTIEMKPDGVTIRQIHGYRNDFGSKDPRELYAGFLEVWLPWLAAGSRRDKQGRPILPQSDNADQTQTPQKEAV